MKSKRRIRKGDWVKLIPRRFFGQGDQASRVEFVYRYKAHTEAPLHGQFRCFAVTDLIRVPAPKLSLAPKPEGGV